MQVELLINDSDDPRSRYVTWTPSPCKVRLSDPTGAPSPGPVSVKLKRVVTASGGSVRFMKTATDPATKTVTLELPLDGSSVRFWLLGEFPNASSSDGDVLIQATRDSTVLAEVPVMVRVRKNANTLTPGERDRFVAALATLNNQGTGRFADFRNMHTNAASPQAHGAPGFLPWHRAYLLDLERELQAIDPSVSLPYWRFDEPAPALFTPEFIGASDGLGVVSFGPTNPLQFWKTDGVQGVNRRPFFDVSTSAPFVLTESETLGLGPAYADFEVMEGNPHGSAHVSFGGFISSIGTAARDPLFFLLHCNVDRLWAKWQHDFGRFDPADAASFDDGGAPGSNPIGHNLDDTMWPWNGITGPPRPPTAPGGTLGPSPCVPAPGPSPQVRACLDYQGKISDLSRLGFDYDDVSF
jgi:tyrosinase